MNTKSFQDTVWGYFRDNGRTNLPWRDDPSPYRVLVSEIMLQQTQVERVVPKFNEFVTQFPTIELLARASLGEVLSAWQGLGYNRRARYLHEAAKSVGLLGRFPDTVDALIKLPGVGKNTAGAIVVYAFDHVSFFVETNIRTVFLHHFFAKRDDVTDAEILRKVEQTFDCAHPRGWCSALMDYGSFLKRQGFGHSTRSKHYVKQSAFSGSVRQLRGQIIRELTVHEQSRQQLHAYVSDPRLSLVLAALVKEKLIIKNGRRYRLPG